MHFVCHATRTTSWISVPIPVLLSSPAERVQLAQTVLRIVHSRDDLGYQFVGNAAKSTAAFTVPLMASSTRAPAPSAVAPYRPESAKAAPTPDSSKLGKSEHPTPDNVIISGG